MNAQDEIDNLKFENQQLYNYLDSLEDKLKHIKDFLRLGIENQTIHLRINNDEDNQNHLNYLKDALEVICTPQPKENKKEKVPQLKSLKNLNK